MSLSHLLPSMPHCLLLVRDVDGQYRPAQCRGGAAAGAARVCRSGCGAVPRCRRRRRSRTTCGCRSGCWSTRCSALLFLDAQHRIIALKEMFRGTVTQTSVYPREVVKEALALNAAAVILAHNHPSGSAEPSRADEFLTQTLKSALALVDVRVIDHLVVTGDAVTSFAERGLL